MPDLAFVVVSALVLWQAGRLRSPRQVWLLAGLVALAALLKSMGLLLAPAAAVAVLVAARPLRRPAWAPLAAGVGVTGIMAVLNLPFVEHTTGYARTYFLVQATDAAAGDASLLDSLGDCSPGPTSWPETSASPSSASTSPPRGPGCWPSPWWRPASGPCGRVAPPGLRAHLLGVSLPALAVWPYSSVRFQLLLVPIAALGVGWLAARLARSPGRGRPWPRRRRCSSW
jgi:hypothetical protein